MVTGDPVRSQNFEAAVTFLSDQLSSLKTKKTGQGTGRSRRVSSVTQGGNGKPSARKKSNKTKHPGGRNGGRSAFDPNNPTKYLTTNSGGVSLMQRRRPLARQEMLQDTHLPGQ